MDESKVFVGVDIGGGDEQGIIRIKYEMDSQDYSLAQCPHADFLLRVGSRVCRKCKYHKGHSIIEQYVDCACPMDEKLTTLPK